MSPADPLRNLGVRHTSRGGEIRVWSAHATSIELCIFDDDDPNWVAKRVPLTRDGDVWQATTRSLVPGAAYALSVDGPSGPTHDFDPERFLLDPYARGLERTPDGAWRSYVQDDSFDWGDARKPGTPLDHTIVYEAHAKGLTKLNPDIPEELRGTYAGLAHPSTIAYLKELGVTAVELLPVHQFVSEQRLRKMGLVNYWGYNTLAFFSPHAGYATREAQFGGTGAVLREFKGMVKLLHEAGLEVILDVVYNHTSEEGPGGPTSSFRGIDNASYYRQTPDGAYIDTTGCGNTLNFELPAAQRLVLDSLRYWANEVQIDGFRFDLAATLGRGEGAEFSPDHPLLHAILDDPALQGVKMIAEPWDVGLGGWQVGNFPDGWSEWNDGYRDRMRNFWLRDIAGARESGTASEGIGSLARRLAGSNHVFSLERGPLASVNFITAHDGFTAADLVAYDRKHNLGNGENNRDGSNDNKSFNHGVEGPTSDEQVLAIRRKAVRNLLGTLLLSAGIPMLTAGDEFGRSQRGNNNAYCHDSELTWLSWDRSEWQQDLFEVVKTLIRLRRENPALRPVRFGRWGETTPSASQMDWYNKSGETMTLEDWDSPEERTLQYLAASTPEFEEFNRILLVVHGLETDVSVTLPAHEGVERYTLLWDSGHDDISNIEGVHRPGEELPMAPTSILLFRAD
ncbi:glycogen debranching protein GlgX [Homoserinibacter sp. GY 40078]|uniref:glycogen debranching protein GlgX n=1 Tax=Homoserinibacter sp. GY 40078 TaxID=2603275 RepID=UPI0011C899F6|nr:glycogen debranching protein GlgX [Homoserinibacter sp. GY 40078]TXK17072.1 glycogen debranching protein GlgX [Homoserinibacter sp. GY 40078]